MYGTFSAIREAVFREGSHYNQKKNYSTIKKLVMKTQLSTTQFSKEVKETLSAVFTNTRMKIISAADVWNIQRNKRNRVQRRFSL
jgi:hypothetical protein